MEDVESLYETYSAYTRKRKMQWMNVLQDEILEIDRTYAASPSLELSKKRQR